MNLITTSFMVIIQLLFINLSIIGAEITISDVDINKIDNAFPEHYSDPNWGFANQGWIGKDANVYFNEQGRLSVTFIQENAGYHNSFGYLILDANDNVIGQQEIWHNTSGTEAGLKGGGTLERGTTVDLGVFDAGTKIGFYIASQETQQAFHTIDTHNPGGVSHTAVWENTGLDNPSLSTILGMEDLANNLSDRDYNDLMFAVNVNKVPGGPAPGPLVTAVISLFTFGIFFLKKHNVC